MRAQMGIRAVLSLMVAARLLVLVAAPAALAAGEPSVATGDAQSVTPTSAALSGSVNPEGQSTTYQFQYGTSTSYGAQTLPTDAGSGSSNVPAAAAIVGLAPGTTYHYRLVATNAARPSNAADRSFMTPNSSPGQRPTVSTGSAKQVTTSSATLTANVNPQ